MNINENILLPIIKQLFERVNRMCEGNEKIDMYYILHTLDNMIDLIKQLETIRGLKNE